MDEPKRLPGGRRKARSQHAQPAEGICCSSCGCRHFRGEGNKNQHDRSKLQYRDCRNCGRRILVKITVVSDNVKKRPAKPEAGG